MRFKAVIAALAIAVFGSSCGVLSPKTDLSNLLKFGGDSAGCLDDVGTRISRFYDGNIDETSWKSTWKCATDSLGLFKKYVRGAVPEGYNREDIHALLEQFMTTNTVISPQLVAALFELKASLFGGSSKVLTMSEIDAIVTFADVLRDESVKLLPYLEKRTREPSPENFITLSDALIVAGDQVALALHTQGNSTFSWSSAQTFVDEIAKLMNLNLDMPPNAMAWFGALKVLFIAGAKDGIEAEAWPRLFRAAVSYGAPAITAMGVDDRYLKGPNASGEFKLQLAKQIRNSLIQTMDFFGGVLPLSALDNVIDSVPDRWFSADVDKVVVKKSLRPLAGRLLMSTAPEAIDRNAIDMIYEKFAFWVRGQTHLEKIFERLNAGPAGDTPKRFVEEAYRYSEGIERSRRPEVYRLIMLARQNRPLFLAGDNQVTFNVLPNHSLTGLTQIHWSRMAAEHVLQAYSTVPGKMLGLESDVQALWNDYVDLGFAFKVLDPTQTAFASQRFRDGNLFTFASNGDKYLDADEITYLVEIMLSATMLSIRIRNGTDAVCPSLGIDLLGGHWKDVSCFRKEFYGNFATYADHFPRLTQFYASLSDAKKLQFQKILERGARRYGYTDSPVGGMDIDNIAGVLHFEEAIFARFDDDSSGVINLNEIMRAYPVFKNYLAEFGKLDPNNSLILEAVFTYTVKHGRAPTTDVWGIASLVSWIAIRPFWSISADRLALFSVIASLTTPEPLPGSTPPKMKGEEFEAEIMRLVEQQAH